MTTTNRSLRPRRRHALVLALLASPDALGLRRRRRRATRAPALPRRARPSPRPPPPRQARRRRLGWHADPDHVRRHASSPRGCRQRHGARSRRSAAADAHLPRPQQRREDRAAPPRAIGRRRARRARSRRRRHRLLGARWRLRPLLRQRRAVLRRHRAHRRVRRRHGSAQTARRPLQRDRRPPRSSTADASMPLLPFDAVSRRLALSRAHLSRLPPLGVRASLDSRHLDLRS